MQLPADHLLHTHLSLTVHALQYSRNLVLFQNSPGSYCPNFMLSKWDLGEKEGEKCGGCHKMKHYVFQSCNETQVQTPSKAFEPNML